MADEPFGGTRREMNRAIRRLGILEWVMLALAAAAALAGGWLVAWLVRDLGLPFQLTWTLAAILLFALPGFSVLAREHREERARHERRAERRNAGEPPVDDESHEDQEEAGASESDGGR